MPHGQHNRPRKHVSSSWQEPIKKECPCGGRYTIYPNASDLYPDAKKTHERSKKHLKFIEEYEEIEKEKKPRKKKEKKEDVKVVNLASPVKVKVASPVKAAKAVKTTDPVNADNTIKIADPVNVAVANNIANVDAFMFCGMTGTRIRFCKCSKLVEDCKNDIDMVQCSNNNCRNSNGERNCNWFHYVCVNYDAKDKNFFCSESCKSTGKKRKSR